LPHFGRFRHYISEVCYRFFLEKESGKIFCCCFYFANIFVLLLFMPIVLTWISRLDFESKLLSAELPTPTDTLSFSPQHQAQYLWGTYRPHLFFGMRTRVDTDATLTGLMWYVCVKEWFYRFIYSSICLLNLFIIKKWWLFIHGLND
jgi:hypothetical protein